MKRAVWIALAFLALFAAIVLPVKSEPPFFPLALCENGVCKLNEKDYEQLRAFHKAVLESASATQTYNAQLEEALAAAKQMVIRSAFCQART